MSDSYYLGCRDCKEAMDIGQSANNDIGLYIYTAEPGITGLAAFLSKHFRHSLVCEFGELLDDEGFHQIGWTRAINEVVAKRTKYDLEDETK